MAIKKDFHTKVVGVTKRNDCDEKIQNLLKDLADTSYEGMPIELEHEADNPYDKNAIKVFCDGDHIGYINRDLAKDLVQYVDDDLVVAELDEVTGGDGLTHGCNIHILIIEGTGKKRQASPKNTSQSAPSNVKSAPQYNLVSSEYLQEVSDEDFQDYAKKFIDYAHTLTPDMDKRVLDYATAQLKIINAEYERRAAKKKNAFGILGALCDTIRNRFKNRIKK